MDAVTPKWSGDWIAQFSVMLGLSVVVAAVGLSLDSVAVVIGAMLLAPLMSPVLGVSAALAMAVKGRLLRSATVVVAASCASVGVAYLVSLVLPDELTPEMLARTSPDLRDLVVALGAGAAGAYATVRTDVSSSLPGAAVAVALVPPLATAGMMLGAGRGDLATGASLLFAANLVAIVLVGALVFLATGFVPRGRLQQKRRHVVGGGLVVAITTLAIAVPLTLASIEAAAAGADRNRVQTAVEAWLSGTSNDIDEVRIDGDVVHIAISGPTEPPPTAQLDRDVQRVLGPNGSTRIRWTQAQDPRERSAAASNDGSASDARIRAVVERWLDTDSDSRFDIQSMTLVDDALRVDIASASPPPPVDDLTAMLVDELELDVLVEVGWTQRTTIDSSAGSLQRQREDIREALARWNEGRSEVEAVLAEYDGEIATIEVVGSEEFDATDLVASIQEITGEAARVEIWFTERTRITSPPR